MSKPRAELISSFRAANGFAAPVVPPAKPVDTPPAKPADSTATTDDVDSDLATKLATLEAAIADVKSTQAKDPDDNTDPNDKAVDAAIAQLETDFATLKDAQDADAKGDADAKTPDDPKNPVADPSDAAPAKLADLVKAKFALPPEATETPTVNPADTEGNVDPDAVCATGGCGHVASVHNDTDTGENTGACTTPECECQGMTYASNTEDGTQTGGPDNAGGEGEAEPGDPSSMAKLAVGDPTDAIPAPVAPADPTSAAPTAPDPDDALNVPPVIPGSNVMGPEFTIPVAIVEGQPTGDGREIALEALYWGPPPYALMALLTSTHDPMGYDPNSPANMVGRIDSFERVPGDGDTQVIVGKGFFFDDPVSLDAASKVDKMGRMPVSGDVTVDESEVTGGDLDEMGWPINVTETLTKGELVAVTILPFGPAFSGAYICLGDGSVLPEAIPQTSDINDKPALPPMPAELTASGQVVHWLSLEDCIPCASDLDVMVASGGPMRPPKAWFEDPCFTEGDGRLMPFIAQGPNGRMVSGYACPPTVTDDGEVFGHIAPWGVCHTGHRGKCIVAPHSAVDYAHFKRGQHVVTAEGDTVRVGVLTANTGHADLRLGANATMDHYDNTAFQAADVVIFEDDYGIAYHGALRPDATETQIRMLRASTLSGDWRKIGGNLELVASLAVNQPGYAPGFIAEIEEAHAVTAGGQVKSLVASGAWPMFLLSHPEVEEITDEDIAFANRAAYKPMIRLIKKDAHDRLAGVRAEVIADARARIGV